VSALLHRLTRNLPDPAQIDRIIYRTIAFGFPLLTMVIITGAVWAQYVWQRWWSWDPKETASLVTWLIYAAYLHGRRQKTWSRSASAWFAVGGLLAVFFTYAGVNYLQSLHSYGMPEASPEGRLPGGFAGVGTPEAALTVGVYFACLIAFLTAAAALVWGSERLQRGARVIAGLAVGVCTAVLILRTIEAQRLTFTSGYDFSLWFVWGILLIATISAWRGNPYALVAGLPLALLVAMYGYLNFPHKGHSPLLPALRNKLWLHLHVSLAIFSYAAFALAAGWGMLYFLKRKGEGVGV
jgi:ABC-type transport system involved in cytochrome c biogenesis permease subunit